MLRLFMGNTYHARGKLVHGYKVRSHPCYTRWSNMKSRCNNPNDIGYVNYGARGISYCSRWESFENFALDMGLPPTSKHTLERLDNNLGYSPENCTWATRSDQCLNRRKFINNTSGYRGVLLKPNGTYVVRYDVGGTRYTLSGSFESANDAAKARSEFISMFKHSPELAIETFITRKARCDSSTGIKGITRNNDGFIVRVTEKGKRKYLGFAKTLEEAKGILNGKARVNRYNKKT